MGVLPLVYDYYQVVYIPFGESEIKESPLVVGAHMLGQALMSIAGSGGTVLSITGINK